MIFIIRQGKFFREQIKYPATAPACGFKAGAAVPRSRAAAGHIGNHLFYMKFALELVRRAHSWEISMNPVLRQLLQSPAPCIFRIPLTSRCCGPGLP